MKAINSAGLSANVIVPSSRETPFLWDIFSSLHKVHYLWWGYQKHLIYSDPDNFFHLMAGHTINFAFGENEWVCFTAQIVAVANRSLAATERWSGVQDSCGRMMQGLFESETLAPNLSWHHEEHHFWIPFSCATAMRSNFYGLCARCKDIFFKFVSLSQAMFALSMSLLDVYEALLPQPGTKREMVAEFFVNFKELNSGTASLESQVRTHEQTIRTILEALGSGATYDNLLHYATKASALNRRVQEGVDSFSAAVGKNVYNDLGKLAGATVHAVTRVH